MGVFFLPTTDAVRIIDMTEVCHIKHEFVTAATGLA